jgi:type IV pilus assembly protein PilP
MTRLSTIACLAASVALAGPVFGRAQQPPPAAPAAGAAPPSAEAQTPPPQSKPAYAYDPAGRRDPFLSLLGRGADPRSKTNRPVGLPGILINEINLKGIMRDRTGFVAMVQGPDNKTYIVKPGDRLMDGTVKSIVNDAVVFSQDVNDPLSLVKQREIKKSLRSEESRG